MYSDASMLVILLSTVHCLLIPSPRSSVALPRSVQALEASIEVLDGQFQACELTKFDVTPLKDARTDRPTKDASLGSTCEHIPLYRTKHFIIVCNLMFWFLRLQGCNFIDGIYLVHTNWHICGYSLGCFGRWTSKYVRPRLRASAKSFDGTWVFLCLWLVWEVGFYPNDGSLGMPFPLPRCSKVTTTEIGAKTLVLIVMSVVFTSTWLSTLDLSTLMT